MSLDLEQDDPIDYDSDEEPGCEDCGSCGLPPPRLRPIYEKIGRSLDEILRLEVELIEENTEVDAELWIHLFAARFRAIMEQDSSGTKSQIKRKLYFND